METSLPATVTIIMTIIVASSTPLSRPRPTTQSDGPKPQKRGLILLRRRPSPGPKDPRRVRELTLDTETVKVQDLPPESPGRAGTSDPRDRPYDGGRDPPFVVRSPASLLPRPSERPDAPVTPTQGPRIPVPQGDTLGESRPSRPTRPRVDPPTHSGTDVRVVFFPRRPTSHLGPVLHGSAEERDP